MNGSRVPAVLLALCAASCAFPPRPARPARTPRPLAAEARRQVDRQYYEAVDAYLKADFTQARTLIKAILAADPGHADAKALLVRVKAVEQASAVPP